MRTLPAFIGSLATVVVVVSLYLLLDFHLGITLGVLLGVSLFAYILAAISPTSVFGESVRGVMIGLNASLNGILAYSLGSLIGGTPLGLALGFGLGALNYIAVFKPVSQSEGYQGVVGWMNWLTPMSWLVSGLGLLFYIFNSLGHLFIGLIFKRNYFRIVGLQMDWKTGTLFQKGGFVSNLNFRDTAFNMGNFSFVDKNSTHGWHIEHEAGHTLNLAAFGSVFHLIGAIDENVLGRGTRAYAELLAESNSSNGVDVIPMWG